MERRGEKRGEERRGLRKPRKQPKANASLHKATAWERCGGANLPWLVGSRAEEHQECSAQRGGDGESRVGRESWL